MAERSLITNIANIKWLAVIVTCSFLTSVHRAQGAAPPNDNYTNRIVLAGNDIFFSGTLAEATRETNANEIVSPFLSGSAMQTVWWDWTASESNTAIIQILNPSNATQGSDAFAVYTLQNISTGQSQGERRIEPFLPLSFFSFPVQAGTNYQIQLSGSDSASFNFRLVVTNTPFIIAQPPSQTVTTGDSAMLTVVGAGLKQYHYQWQLNETNLPGETFPILMLRNVTFNQAGPYRVVITNVAGTTISDIAHLEVTPGDAASTLTMRRLNASQFAFTVLGEVGRRYRIESSTTLGNWSAEESFPPIAGQGLRSVIFDSTGADDFTVTNGNLKKFFRARVFHASNEICNNNLKVLRFAALLWANENGQGASSTVTLAGIIPYIKQPLPACPSGGFYGVTTVAAPPTCSKAAALGHTFDEP